MGKNGDVRRYDWHSRDGRAALDRDVRAALEDAPLGRGQVAWALRVDVTDERVMDAVSASLRRGVRDGWARADGARGQTRYAAVR